MTLLSESVEQKKFDVRVAQRSVERGKLKAEELEKFVASLPDDSANADFVAIQSFMDEAQDEE
ncbi:MAG: hypothetical protein JNL01_15455 [Bdellovibrionales bacterium]|nr:hypothetical protein [Bdellovibrionales bacterium]